MIIIIVIMKQVAVEGGSEQLRGPKDVPGAPASVSPAGSTGQVPTLGVSRLIKLLFAKSLGDLEIHVQL